MHVKLLEPPSPHKTACYGILNSFLSLKSQKNNCISLSVLCDCTYSFKFHFSPVELCQTATDNTTLPDGDYELLLLELGRNA